MKITTKAANKQKPKENWKIEMKLNVWFNQGIKFGLYKFVEIKEDAW